MKTLFPILKEKKSRNIIFYRKERLGTAGPIEQVNEKTVFPMIIINADLITDLKFSNLLNFQNNNKNALTVGVKRKI